MFNLRFIAMSQVLLQVVKILMEKLFIPVEERSKETLVDYKNDREQDKDPNGSFNININNIFNFWPLDFRKVKVLKLWSFWGGI